MNANELADYLDDNVEAEFACEQVHITQAATMLRQQQTEIEVLRNSHIELERGIVKDLNQRQSAEPVAYVNSMCNDYIDWKVEPMSIDGQSLYTHPAKELTNEEIRHIQAICHLKDVGYDNFIMRFARAILRKAQEK